MKPDIDDAMEQAEEGTFWGGFVQGLKESPALYFAPLMLLFKAIRSAFGYIATVKPAKPNVQRPCQGK